MTSDWETLPDPNDSSEQSYVWHWKARLGKGGQGEVSVWEDSETNAKLAVKVCHLKNCREYVRYWLREVHVMGKLRHPNVVKSFAVPNDISSQIRSSLPLLAMEYCDGGNLRSYCGPYRHGMPEWQLRIILKDLCLGLRYLHRKHIIHRDLKPDNIVVSRGEVPVFKITDLGFVKILTPSEQTRSFIATRGYNAPEVAFKNRKLNYNYLIDYWSLGITVCEVTLGRHPFVDYSKIASKGDAIYLRRTITGHRFKAELPKKLPLEKHFRKALSQWLRAMLSLCPAERNPLSDVSSLDVMLRLLALTKPEPEQWDAELTNPLTRADEEQINIALMHSPIEDE